MIRGFLCLALLWGSLLFGQLDSNSVVVTVSNNATAAPDQVVFNVGVTAPLGVSLDDIIAALAGTGITPANLTGASNGSFFSPTGIPPGTITWGFSLPVPFSQMKAIVAALNGAQQNIMLATDRITVSFNVQGTQVSAQSQQSQSCSAVDLISAARTKAQNFAAIAGLTLGNILAMSSPPSTSGCSLTVKFQLLR